MIGRRSFIAALLALCAVPALAAGFVSERFTVKTEGSGSDVILIPGLASSPRVWSEMIKALPGHRYHVLHIAGFAGLPKGANSDGPVAAPVAEEIARYIAFEKLGKPAVIGHSLGGSIGMMLAARHPDAVSRLMVVDMMPFVGALFGPPGTTAASVKPTADAILARMKSEEPAVRLKQAEANLVGMINTVAMRPGAIEDSATSDLEVTARAFHELIVTDLKPELPNIKVPLSVLFVVPAGVPMNEAQMTGFYRTMFAGVPGAQFKFVADSAHFIMWDQPAVFQNEVKLFLAR